MSKRKNTTRKQVVDLLVKYLLADYDGSVLRKIDGIAYNDACFMITFKEKNGRYTNIQVNVGEPETFEMEEDDDDQG